MSDLQSRVSSYWLILVDWFQYDMVGNIKGRAFILNNIEFNTDTRLTRRKGSDVDFNNFIHLFEEMGYQVEKAMNKTVEVNLKPQTLLNLFNL